MAVRQGEIYWVDLQPTRGREQRGRRPALVISRDSLNRLPLTVLVMIGTGAEHLEATQRYPTDLWVTATESGLPKDTVFLGLQLRSIDPSRFGEKAGQIARGRLSEVFEIVRYLIGEDQMIPPVAAL